MTEPAQLCGYFVPLDDAQSCGHRQSHPIIVIGGSMGYSLATGI